MIVFRQRRIFMRMFGPLVVLVLGIIVFTKLVPENSLPSPFSTNKPASASNRPAPPVDRGTTNESITPQVCPGNSQVEPIRVDELVYGFDCNKDLKVDVEWWKAEKLYIFFADTREEARLVAKPLRCVTEESGPATKELVVVCDPHTIEYFGRSEAQAREAQARFDRARD
jgi:hypothetical protein